jgi:hypothetical protein
MPVPSIAISCHGFSQAQPGGLDLPNPIARRISLILDMPSPPTANHACGAIVSIRKVNAGPRIGGREFSLGGSAAPTARDKLMPPRIPVDTK